MFCIKIQLWFVFVLKVLKQVVNFVFIVKLIDENLFFLTW